MGDSKSPTIRVSNNKHCIRADLMMELLTPLAVPL